MKVLFYCQHLLGIGHVTRSLCLVNELARDFEVTYVQGGPPVPLEPSREVRKVQLDPLLMREGDSSLYDPSGIRGVEEIFASRKKALHELAREGFDAVVIELYPFGRKKFGPEVLELLEELKKANRRIKVVSSVRDILVEKADSGSRNRKIADLILGHFDAVWVHSDPNLIRFSDTFSEEARIRDLVAYTGFVAEPPKAEVQGREKKILLSLGGGSVGEELYHGVAGVVGEFPDYRFQFVLGPYSSPGLRGALESRLKEHSSRVEITGLLSDFEEVLSRSALSLSMAGYNTVMNLLNTRTPALVMSYDANHEQRMRASLLERRGYLRVLDPGDLRPETLTRLMKERLTLPYPGAIPDLGGSSRSRELLGELLGPG